MLARGVKYFKVMTEDMKGEEGEGIMSVPGDRDFILYGTLGFSINLTDNMAEEVGLNVDKKKGPRKRWRVRSEGRRR